MYLLLSFFENDFIKSFVNSCSTGSLVPLANEILMPVISELDLFPDFSSLFL